MLYLWLHSVWSSVVEWVSDDVYQTETLIWYWCGHSVLLFVVHTYIDLVWSQFGVVGESVSVSESGLFYINLVWSKNCCDYREFVVRERKPIPYFGVVWESVSVSEWGLLYIMYINLVWSKIWCGWSCGMSEWWRIIQTETLIWYWCDHSLLLFVVHVHRFGVVTIWCGWRECVRFVLHHLVWSKL